MRTFLLQLTSNLADDAVSHWVKWRPPTETVVAEGSVIESSHKTMNMTG